MGGMVTKNKGSTDQATPGGQVYFHDLPEGCMSTIIGYTTPRDACRLEAVSKIFRSASESDLAWEQLLPSDYRLIVARSAKGDSLLFDYPSKKELYLRLADHPILIDGSTKSFWLEKSSGKKCFMISARSLSIMWGDTPEYWRWTSNPDSRFKEVAELMIVCWLEIKGKIKTSLLSPQTSYGAYLVFKMTEAVYGFEYGVDVSVGVAGQETKVQTVHLCNLADLPWMGYELLGSPMVLSYRSRIFDHRDKGNKSSHLKKREDGWMEIEIGVFFTGDGEDEVELSVFEVKHGNWKSGLIVEGIEVRPQKF